DAEKEAWILPFLVDMPGRGIDVQRSMGEQDVELIGRRAVDLLRLLVDVEALRRRGGDGVVVARDRTDLDRAAEIFEIGFPLPTVVHGETRQRVNQRQSHAEIADVAV